MGLLFLDVFTKAANVKFVITQNPNIGRARKQIGGWIFYKHYTKNVARSRPIEVKPNNSPLRILQRGDFRLIFEFGSFVLNYFRFAFMGMAVDKSAFSCYMHENLPGAVNKLVTPHVLDLTRMNWGGMNLPPLDALQVTTITGGKIEFDFNATTELPGEPTDQIAFLIFDSHRINQGFVNPAYDGAVIATRSTGTFTYTLPAHLAAATSINVVVLCYNPTKYHAGNEWCSKAQAFLNLVPIP